MIEYVPATLRNREAMLLGSGSDTLSRHQAILLQPRISIFLIDKGVLRRGVDLFGPADWARYVNPSTDVI